MQLKQKEKEIRLLILGLDNAGKTTVLKQFCGDPNIDTIEPTLGFHIQTLQYYTSNNSNNSIHTTNHENSSSADSSSSSSSSCCYTLNLWDVGGQSSIRAYWKNYFEATDGIIWVVDSTDHVRLQLCKHELEQLLQHERLAGATLLILANKQDVAGPAGPRSNNNRSTSNAATSTTRNVEEKTNYGTSGGGRALSVTEIAQALELNVDNDNNNDNDNHNQTPDKNIPLVKPMYRNRHWSIRPCSARTGEGLAVAMDWMVQDISQRLFLLN